MYCNNKNDLDYKLTQKFRKTHKFYCDYCGSYYYIRDEKIKILCNYCNHYVYNTNNPDGKREYFKKKIKELMK